MKKGDVLRLAAATVVFGSCFGPTMADEAKSRWRLELFTSEGCSSCPPADAILQDLAKKGEVVALSYHVDYRDYLGWQDTLATPDNTARQYDYAKAFGVRSVYTPQAVINGRTHVNGSSRADIDFTLGGFAKSGEGLSVDIKVMRAGDSVVIDAGEGAAQQEGQIVLVYYDPARPVVIDRGENNGETINYWNWVTAILGAGHVARRRRALRVSGQRDRQEGRRRLCRAAAVDRRERPSPGRSSAQP